MNLAEKLSRAMLQRGLTQQALAKKANVSDSEVSRLLNGQSKRPGLHNILRLARALDISLDYLADDALDRDPHAPGEALSGDQREILERANTLGIREALMVLDAARVLGYEMAIRRLYGLDVKGEDDDLGSGPSLSREDVQRP